MDLGLQGKIAFIAASSQGLGKSVALELAAEGAHVIICGRHEQSLEMAREEIGAVGDGEVLALQGDLTSRQDREQLIRSTLEEFGHIDILVTNSGGPPAGHFDDFSLEDWEEAYRLLVESAVGLIKGFLPGMKNRGGGRIIFITSQSVKQPVDNIILSNAVRTALVGLMKSLAAELGPSGITVNNVMPGYTETDRLSRLIETNPEMAEAAVDIPLGRFGRPEEFAAAVAFLASERASYITGVSLPVDGGWIKGI